MGDIGIKGKNMESITFQLGYIMGLLVGKTGRSP